MLERSFLPQARIFLVLLRACTATRPTDSFAVCSRGGVAKYRSRRGSATSSAPQWKHGVSCPRAGVTCTCMACDDEPATIAARPPRMGAVAVSFAPPAIRCGDPRPVRPARYQRRQDICVRGDSLMVARSSELCARIRKKEFIKLRSFSRGATVGISPGGREG
jgi:hypothetical protein